MLRTSLFVLLSLSVCGAGAAQDFKWNTGQNKRQGRAPSKYRALRGETSPVNQAAR